jgi:hypothetical protein
MDLYLLLTPFAVLAIVVLLAFAGCALSHATGRPLAIVVVDFDPAVGLVDVALSIRRTSGTVVTTSTIAAGPRITPAISGDGSALTATAIPGTGSYRLDISGASTAESWTVTSSVGVTVGGVSIVPRPTAMAAPRTLSGTVSFPFTLDTRDPAMVRLTAGFP